MALYYILPPPSLLYQKKNVLQKRLRKLPPPAPSLCLKMSVTQALHLGRWPHLNLGKRFAFIYFGSSYWSLLLHTVIIFKFSVTSLKSSLFSHIFPLPWLLNHCCWGKLNDSLMLANWKPGSCFRKFLVFPFFPNRTWMHLCLQPLISGYSVSS